MTGHLLTSLPLDAQVMMLFMGILTLFFHVRFDEKTTSYAPTILTTTGIFATFLGIALGLVEFDSANVQSSVPNLLNGLKTAFWASVAGVGGALTIKFRHFFFGARSAAAHGGISRDVTASDIAVLLKGIQQALVGAEDSTLVSQLKLMRSDTNDRLDALGKSQQEALSKLSEMGSRALVEALRDVIREFNAKISEQFGDNFKQLNEAVGALLIWQEQYKTHIEYITSAQHQATSAMQKATDDYSTMVDRSTTFSKAASDLSFLLTELERQKSQLVGVLTQLGTLLHAASGSLPQIEDKVVALTGQLSTAVTENQKDVSRALSENAALIQAAVQTAGQDIEKLNSSFNLRLEEMSSRSKEQVAAFADRLGATVTQNQEQVGKALSDNVIMIRSSIQAVGQDFEKVNSEFNAQLNSVSAKIKEQVAVLDAALAEELKKSLESLGRQLAALSEKFVADYSPLTDKLQRLVDMARA